MFVVLVTVAFIGLSWWFLSIPYRHRKKLEKAERAKAEAEEQARVRDVAKRSKGRIEADVIH